MRALTWHGVNDLRVETAPDPEIVSQKDVILKVTMSSVCGSDLHLLGGYIPAMKPGDIIGHEFMGEVVETGREVRRLKKGDRAVAISILGCGQCEHCRRTDFSCCDNTNPKPLAAEELWGHSPAGIIGYSHMLGGWAGSHATYIRVPFADVNVFPVPEGIPDEKAVFVSDACPTGFMGADLAGIQPGDVVAVWGCGGVGLMAIQSAYILGAERVIAIDRIPERLRLAKEHCKAAEVIDYSAVDVHEALMAFTGGRGPDRCIECVGMEAHDYSAAYVYDTVKHQVFASERIVSLRQAIEACRKGGTVSVVGVFGALVDKFPMGAVVNKALTLRAGQQHGQRYAERLFGHIQRGEMDPSPLLTHPMPLEESPRGYDLFKNKKENCIRAVFKP